MSEYVCADYIAEDGMRQQEWREEIVRCRDCKHFEVIDGWFKWCSFHNMDVKEHDFCSKGERREGC